MTTLTQLSGEANHPAHQTLELAAIYARAGARVLPLRPKSKAASLNDWPNNATTDQNQITKWFGNGTAYNIGLAMGTWAHTETDKTYLVCVDIDMHGDTNGLENWQQLVAQNGGNEGQPFIADTATGGLHLVYVSPVELTNERGALPQGIDVRGQGGYIMTEPSTHPDNGRKPKWRAGSSWPTAKPGLMPQWLLDIITTKPEPIQRTATTEPRLRALGDAPRPGDIYNNANTWPQVLAKYGWQLIEQKGDKTYWARPGKPATRDAHSAVLAHDAGEHGVFTVFSTSAPRELMRNDHHTDTGGHYKFTSPFDFYACMEHEGDHKRAAQMFGAEVRKQQQPDIDRLMGTATKPQLTVVNSDNKTEQPTDEPKTGHTWVLRDMSELVGVPYEPVMPDRLMMTNGRGLAYSGEDNLFAGASGVMKSWVQAVACLQQIQLGKHAVIIDYEMTMHKWFMRLRMLGATDTELKLVHYCRPNEALQYREYNQLKISPAENQMRTELARISELPGGIGWVVVDGITAAMTQHSLKLVDNTDTAQFWNILMQQIVRLTGAGVGSNDHIAKGANDNPSPLGAQHKIAATSGAAHILKATSHLSRYPMPNPGVVVFNCIKDRHGEIGQGKVVAQAVFTPLDNGLMRAVIEPFTGEHAQVQSTKDAKLFAEIKQLNDKGITASLNTIHKGVGGTKAELKDRLLRHASKGKLRNIGTDSSMNWQVVQSDIDETELF